MNAGTGTILAAPSSCDASSHKGSSDASSQKGGSDALAARNTPETNREIFEPREIGNGTRASARFSVHRTKGLESDGKGMEQKQTKETKSGVFGLDRANDFGSGRRLATGSAFVAFVRFCKRKSAAGTGTILAAPDQDVTARLCTVSKISQPGESILRSHDRQIDADGEQLTT